MSFFCAWLHKRYWIFNIALQAGLKSNGAPLILRYNMLISCIIALFISALMGGPAWGVGALMYKFTAVDSPYGSNYTSITGINNQGLSFGLGGDPYVAGGLHLFTYDINSNTFNLIPEPQSCSGFFPGANNINDSGQFVVSCKDSSKNIVKGYFYNNGEYTTIFDTTWDDYPLCEYGVVEDTPGWVNVPCLYSTMGALVATWASGINNSGQIVGGTGASVISDPYSFNSAEVSHGFIGNPNNHIDPMDNGNMFYSINNKGHIVGSGSTSDGAGWNGCFLYNTNDNSTMYLSNSPGCLAFGINDFDQVMMNYVGLAYLNDLSTGNITAFKFPGSVQTQAIGINNSGVIVGQFNDGMASHGFVAKPVEIKPPKNLGDVCYPHGCEGNPINTASGNKIHSDTHYAGDAHTDLKLTLFYNSQEMTSSVFGSNWHSSYHRGLTFSTDGTKIMVSRLDGRVDKFTKSFTGSWTSDPDVTSVLSAIFDASNNQNGWQLTLPDDSAEIYSMDGRLSSVVSRTGLSTNLTYDSYFRLATVTGPFGHTLNFTYDNMGRVTSFTDPGGAVYNYSYDAYSNLASVKFPDGSSRKYLYESTSFLNALTGIIDENINRFATYTYDDQARAISSEHAGGVNKITVTYNSDGSADITDANGKVKKNTFTTLFDVVKPTTKSNPGGASGSNSYTYDVNGFVASWTDANGNVTTYIHDARGLELSRTEAAGTPQARTITTQWHATYHLPTQITEPGRVTTFTYDNKGNLLQKTITAGTLSRTWTYTYNTFGQVLTANGPRTDVNDLTTFTYDAQGNLASVTNALGHVTSFTSYDANGRPLSMTDPNGLVTTFTYDLRGRLTSQTAGQEATTYTYDPAGNLVKITQPDGSYLSYSYDAAHRLIGINDALGNSVAYTLDLMGNLINEKVYDPSNQLTQSRTHAYDALNRLIKDIGAQNQTTTYGYDNNGNRISVIDPLNQVTSSTFDALNRLIRTIDPNNGSTTLVYDANDRLTSLSDARGSTTGYAYNGLDDLTTLQSPDSGSTAKTYDSAGNIATSSDARGKTTTYVNDALNRLTSATFADGKTIAWQYDQGTNGKDRLTGMTDANGSTNWSYEPHGRVIQKQQRTGAVTLTTSYAYNSAGQLTGMTYPSGRQLTYLYDAAGRISGINVDGSALLSSVTYQPFGGVAGWHQGQDGALTHNRTFDQDGRISGIAIKSAISTETITLTYDAASRITGIADSAGKQPDLNADSVNYAYESASNKLTSATGAVPRSYTHDAAGNLISDGTNTFLYDARGRMSQVTSGGVTTQYAVNGIGQRINKSGPGVPTGAIHFVYDEAGHLMGEYDATGGVIQETVWLNDLPVGILKTGARYYVNPEHLGTPLSIVDVNGTVVWRWDHDPFGSGMPDQSPSGGDAFVYNLRFPGQYYDSETGLFYNYHRDYSPVLGRYVQSDPIGLKGGVNTYGYVLGNPLGSSDAKGLDKVTLLDLLGYYRLLNNVSNFFKGASEYLCNNDWKPLSEWTLKNLLSKVKYGAPIPLVGVSQTINMAQDVKDEIINKTNYATSIPLKSDGTYDYAAEYRKF